MRYIITQYTRKYEKSKNCFETLENSEADLSWNGKSVKRLGGTRVQTRDQRYDFNTNIPQAVSNISPDLDKHSNDDL